MNLNREMVIKSFIINFPEYGTDLNQHIEDYGEVLVHVFFGDTVNENLIELINDDKENSGEIKKIFDFFEKMASEGDEDVKEVLTVTILERLGDDANTLEKSYKYMGENTIKASQEIEKFWGR